MGYATSCKQLPEAKRLSQEKMKDVQSINRLYQEVRKDFAKKWLPFPKTNQALHKNLVNSAYYDIRNICTQEQLAAFKKNRSEMLLSFKKEIQEYNSAPSKKINSERIGAQKEAIDSSILQVQNLWANYLEELVNYLELVSEWYEQSIDGVYSFESKSYWKASLKIDSGKSLVNILTFQNKYSLKGQIDLDIKIPSSETYNPDTGKFEQTGSGVKVVWKIDFDFNFWMDSKKIAFQLNEYNENITLTQVNPNDSSTQRDQMALGLNLAKTALAKLKGKVVSLDNNEFDKELLDTLSDIKKNKEKYFATARKAIEFIRKNPLLEPQYALSEKKFTLMPNKTNIFKLINDTNKTLDIFSKKDIQELEKELNTLSKETISALVIEVNPQESIISISGKTMEGGGIFSVKTGKDIVFNVNVEGSRIWINNKVETMKWDMTFWPLTKTYINISDSDWFSLLFKDGNLSLTSKSNFFWTQYELSIRWPLAANQWNLEFWIALDEKPLKKFASYSYSIKNDGLIQSQLTVDATTFDEDLFILSIITNSKLEFKPVIITIPAGDITSEEELERILTPAF